MAVSRQDADALSVQVTAAADSMKQTEDAVNSLQHLTGMESALEDTPPILQADMARVLGEGRSNDDAHSDTTGRDPAASTSAF